MTRRGRALTLADLPLYATDRELGEAILGPGRAADWEVIAAREETRGLPPIDRLYGGRYVPAVKAFFDRRHGLAPAIGGVMPDGEETWPDDDQRRASASATKPVRARKESPMSGSRPAPPVPRGSRPALVRSTT